MRDDFVMKGTIITLYNEYYYSYGFHGIENIRIRNTAVCLKYYIQYLVGLKFQNSV